MWNKIKKFLIYFWNNQDGDSKFYPHLHGQLLKPKTWDLDTGQVLKEGGQGLIDASKDITDTLLIDPLKKFKEMYYDTPKALVEGISDVYQNRDRHIDDINKSIDKGIDKVGTEIEEEAQALADKYEEKNPGAKDAVRDAYQSYQEGQQNMSDDQQQIDENQREFDNRQRERNAAAQQAGQYAGRYPDKGVESYQGSRPYDEQGMDQQASQQAPTGSDPWNTDPEFLKQLQVWEEEGRIPKGFNDQDSLKQMYGAWLKDKETGQTTSGLPPSQIKNRPGSSRYPGRGFYDWMK